MYQAMFWETKTSLLSEPNRQKLLFVGCVLPVIVMTSTLGIFSAVPSSFLATPSPVEDGKSPSPTGQAKANDEI